MTRLNRLCRTSSMDFYAADCSSGLELPFASTDISAGFPSPADDYLEVTLDLNRELVRHPQATFYGRVKGSSMIDAGIQDGDILVIDKSLEPANGDIAVCYLDGEFTVKRIEKRGRELFLMPANERFSPLRITSESSFEVWGVVTYVIHKAR
ncbi:translesion error-prone DNA polymerase V autoproteolytic subunit [Prosthecochloris sp. N3]|uniref:Translesion error-prone DNA polymerase V autoproteolytic subunit n=1 Tax=Prosthecochloris ethylica TaxID=2743976 RepID=A0ABR9XSZ5_9CHLB|nr:MULTISPECIES: translesion error-prone DNA polymerase V autoproteolytic subunit [Prosthecochloris]MEC9486670.1 translesion error-prone DNA polymerase V autoproteolytic subunit [Prosthecochloris sp.]MBF0586952.1 translesion error-prone DNA polymerase V autoproteolytic subunit [Prosthecochloris ethylica]MBF0637171.1 translesion error-prone DNA polymerase V autoproteolytic subunit [Prosthecochloris ethylica]NUK48179.1 translesion error-prone DNA polymerase V autoproteolytic subunit [Prosthecochl